jgi:hypothetical protein
MFLEDCPSLDAARRACALTRPARGSPHTLSQHILKGVGLCHLF